MKTWGVVILLALVAACGDNIAPPEDAGDAAPTADARVDAGPDAAADARVDAAPDAGHCAASECTFGQTRCGSDGTVVACDVDGSGCGHYAAGGGAACGVHQACGGASGAAACACNADATCTNGAGTYCTDGSDVATCTADPQGCVYASATTACTGVTSCGDGSPTGAAACMCPADGSAAGDGCSAAGSGAQTCDGTDVLTCTTVGACEIWETTTACGGSSLVCAASGSSASCACPSATGGTYIADPNAVAITVGSHTLAPTGAASPVGCRYSVFVDAIIEASAYYPVTGSDATVFIESASPGTFVDQDPAAISGNVIVTSDDPAIPPARYTIRTNGYPFLVAASAALGGVVIVPDITATPGLGEPRQAALQTFGDADGSAVATLGPLAITFGSNATGVGIDVEVPAIISNTTITGAYNGIVVGSGDTIQDEATRATISSSTIENSHNDGIDVYATDATGVTITGTTIASSASTGLWIDANKVAFSAHTATVAMTGALGTTTITNDQNSATGIEANGSGATLTLTDVTVDGTSPGTGIAPGDSVQVAGATATLLGTVLEHNGFRGLYQSGGVVTLADDAAGNHVTITGAQLGNSGLRIDAGATLTATNAVVESNSAWGANITNSGSAGALGTTTVSLFTCTFANNSNATYLDGGVQVGGNDGSDTVVLAIVGGTYGSNAAAGIHVGSNATVGLAGAVDVEHDGHDGLQVDGVNSTVTYHGSGSPVFSNNTGAGIYQTAGTVTIAPTTGTPAASSNTTNGIYVGGAGNFIGSGFLVERNTGVQVAIATTDGTCALSDSTVQRFTTSGITIDNQNPVANAVVLDNLGVQALVTPGTGTYGIEVDRSSLPATGYSTVIENGYVENAETGIGLGAGTSNDLAVSVTGEFIENNKACGIVVDSTTSTSKLDLEDNQIIYNQATPIGILGAMVGGLALEGDSPLTGATIQDNTIGGNSGDQIAVFANSGELGMWSTDHDELDKCSTSATTFDLYAESAGTGVASVISTADDWPGVADVSSQGPDTSTTVAAATYSATCPTP